MGHEFPFPVPAHLFGPDERSWLELSAAEAVEALRTLQAAHEAHGHPAPAGLPLGAIVPVPALFQPRHMNERHISDLTAIIARQGYVDPLLVMRIGQIVVLLDGHHRREAYRAAGVQDDIPVEFFQGSLEEAIAASGEANSKARLPMTNSERLDYAWRLVRLGLPGHSKAKIAAAAGIATRTVATMRRVLRERGEDVQTVEQWWRVRQDQVDRDEMTDEDRSAWIAEQAEQYADRLGRTFGNKLTTNVEVAAYAIALHFGGRSPELVQELLWKHINDGARDEIIDPDPDSFYLGF